jgi:uncharacterized protein YijF (DUF1287 family)
MTSVSPHVKIIGVCLLASALGCAAVWAARTWLTAPVATTKQADTANGFSVLDNATNPPPDAPPAPQISDPFLAAIVASAVQQTEQTHLYDPAYVQLKYPGGDVPLERGVCADVIVRACRAGGLDLQKEVHEDMTRRFAEYPQQWGQRGPDANIDHRRVANLRVYFRRFAQTLPITDRGDGYAPGDVVVWQLPQNRLHIGLVIDRLGDHSRRPLVVHNVGRGTRAEDVLTAWPILDHFRLRPPQR